MIFKMESKEWKIVVQQNEEGYLADQQMRFAANECQKMFSRIDGLLLNIDKLLNVNHPKFQERVKANLAKSNYRQFCFRMIKKLVLEIIAMAHAVLAQIHEKPLKTWLERIDHGVNKILWVINEYFNALTKLEDNDGSRKAEKRQKFDQDIAYNISRYSVHLDEAKRELHARVRNWQLRSVERVEKDMVNLGHAGISESAHEQRQSDKTSSQTGIKHEGEMQHEEHTPSISRQNVLNGSFADAYDLQDFDYLGYTNNVSRQSSTYTFASDSGRTKRNHDESENDPISIYKKAKANSFIKSTSTIP